MELFHFLKTCESVLDWILLQILLIKIIIVKYCYSFLFRKSLYKGTPNFIHLNLALSLLIGLIIFVSAIETAKDNEVVFVFII